MNQPQGITDQAVSFGVGYRALARFGALFPPGVPSGLEAAPKARGQPDGNSRPSPLATSLGATQQAVEAAGCGDGLTESQPEELFSEA